MLAGAAVTLVGAAYGRAPCEVPVVVAGDGVRWVAGEATRRQRFLRSCASGAHPRDDLRRRQPGARPAHVALREAQHDRAGHVRRRHARAGTSW